MTEPKHMVLPACLWPVSAQPLASPPLYSESRGRRLKSQASLGYIERLVFIVFFFFNSTNPHPTHMHPLLTDERSTPESCRRHTHTPLQNSAEGLGMATLASVHMVVVNMVTPSQD